MPINIRFADMEKHGVREIAHLCEDEWGLPMQLRSLEEWLKEKSDQLSDEEIVADLGFKIGPDAAGGGSALSCEFMAFLVEAKIELWLSEYPPGDCLVFEDKEPIQSVQTRPTSGPV